MEEYIRSFGIGCSEYGLGKRIKRQGLFIRIIQQFAVYLEAHSGGRTSSPPHTYINPLSVRASNVTSDPSDGITSDNASMLVLPSLSELSVNRGLSYDRLYVPRINQVWREVDRTSKCYGIFFGFNLSLGRVLQTAHRAKRWVSNTRCNTASL
ncbi:unnamed protein product [Rhizoctonia solani]|uniref:Uncharacterized protein n=1 Tax=Rhizoctonia solani TaxID=456999 RepID=A0A8H2XM51_9AGAM|nr:unnamed protein product [Rhizoctonia solani]